MGFLGVLQAMYVAIRNSVYGPLGLVPPGVMNILTYLLLSVISLSVSYTSSLAMLSILTIY